MSPKRASELEYLRWFYENTDFGPADGDVREIMNRQFVQRTGLLIPLDYEEEE